MSEFSLAISLKKKLFLLTDVIIAILIASTSMDVYALDCSTAYASPILIWPPDHKMIDISIAGINGDGVEIDMQCIMQDEPLNEDGDGNTEYDGEILGDSVARVRGERQGGDNGRVYHIDFIATDAQDAACAGEVIVSVPHNKKSIAVDDGRLYESTEFPGQCSGQLPNQEPVADNVNITGDEDTEISITLSATDPDADLLTYQIISQPQNGVLSGEAPDLTYTPVANFNGEDSFTYLVNDGALDSNVAEVMITVNPVNDVPTAVNQTVETDQNASVEFQLSGEDIDGDTLSFQITDAPVNGVLSGDEPVLTYTPNPGFYGTDSFTYVVSDGVSSSDDVTVSFVINQVDFYPPIIISSPVTFAVENQNYTYDVDATDADVGDILAYTLGFAPTGATIDSDSGVINWVPSTTQNVGHNIEDNPYCANSQLAGNQNPVSDMIVVIDESVSMQGEHAWISQLIPLLDTHLRYNGIGNGSESNLYGLVGFGDRNVVPRQVDVGGEAMGSALAFIQAPASLTTNGGTEDGWAGLNFALGYPLRANSSRNMILVTDEDRDNTDDNISFESLKDALSNLGVILNVAVNARFKCGNGRDAVGLGQNGTGYVADGQGGYTRCENTIITTASGTTQQDYINLALSLNGAAWDINVLRAGGIAAESFSNAFVAIKVQEIKNQLEAIPQADVVITELTLVNDQVSVTVRNRGLVDITDPVDITVRDGSITIADFTSPALAIGESVTFSTDYYETPDNELNAEVVIRQQTVDECASDNNRLVANTFNVTVTDAGGLTDTQNYAVTVMDQNQAPMITSTPVTSASVATNYEYTVMASDPDTGDGLVFSLLEAPNGMVIDELTGQIRFRPDAGQTGDYNIVVRVSDIGGLSDMQSYTLTVNTDYVPPHFVSEPDQRAVVGTLYQYQPEVESSSELLTYRFFFGPEGMTVDTDSGLVEWSVPADVEGQQFFAIIGVSDEYGNYDEQLFILTGDVPASAPVITTVQLPQATQGVNYNRSISASDENYVDTLLWEIEFAPVELSIDPVSGRLDWLANVSVPALERNENPYCRSPGSSSENMEVITRWYAAGQSIIQPLVGPLYDSNQDGVLNLDDRKVVVGVTSSGRVSALDAATGELLWQRTNVGAHARTTAALINLDGDNTAEIVFMRNSDDRLVALNADGTDRWVSNSIAADGNFDYNAITPTDIDGDGLAELLFGPSVFNSDGELLWQFPLSAQTYSRAARGNALAVDLNQDGFKEIIYYDQVRDWQGNLLWTIPEEDGSATQRWGYFAAANFDADPEPEIVANEYRSRGGNRLKLIDNDGSLIWQQSVSVSGTLILADFDRDDMPEIYSPSNNALYESDGEVIWDRVNGGYHYGATVADVNADGYLEILKKLSPGSIGIQDSRTGLLAHQILFKTSSVPQAAPVFVDIDNDGMGEILAGSSSDTAVFGGRNNNWPVASTTYTYLQQNIGAVNDDLTPSLNNSINSYGQTGVAVANTQPSGLLPDLIFNELSVYPQGNGWIAEGQVYNRGTLPIDESVQIELFADDPAQTSNLIGTASIATLDVDETAPFSLAVNDFETIGSELFAVANGDSAISECSVENNSASAVALRISVTDRDGLSDTQSWAIGAVENSTLPNITSTPVITARELELYEYQVEAIDVNTTDEIRFVFEAAPPGMTLDCWTGLIRWVPRLGQAGAHSVVVRVIDLDNRIRRQPFTITVEPAVAANNPPVITSQASLLASAGFAYRYQVLASDPDGEYLTYSIDTTAAGMTINSLTGRVDWLPGVAELGSYPVTITVTDQRGAQAQQSYTLEVIENSPPQIESQPGNNARLNLEYQYQVIATDADGDALSYELIQAPAGMTVDAAGLIQWTPTDLQTATATVRVSDATSYVEQTWPINVLPSEANLSTDIVITPNPVDEGETLTIQVIPINAVEPVTATLAVDGIPVPLDSNRSAQITATGIGEHSVGVTVTDNYGSVNASGSFTVRDGTITDAPVVDIISPSHLQIISEPVDVTISVNDDNLSNWQLLFAPKNAEAGEAVILAEGSDVVADQVVATFDPTLLMNGQYNLVLQATDAGGQTGIDNVVLLVDGDMKVGNFSFTIEDLNIPVSGIPIRVTRTYDSRRRNEDLDFGFGWSIDYQNVRVDESRTLGLGWQINEIRSGPFGAIVNQCVQPQGAPIVSVALPTGRIERFEARANPECNLYVPIIDVQLEFVPMDGTLSTLEITDAATVRLVNGNLVILGENNIYDTDLYTLITKEGFVYELDQNIGILSVADPNGNTLTYTDDGILHSDGKSVLFNRDAEGRIDSITDPMGNLITYSYDTAGDLVSVADQLNNTAQYTYNTNHGLLDIIDPLGRTIVRNIYDDDGRLIGQEDADGNLTEFNHDLAGRLSVVTDRLGRATQLFYDDYGQVINQVDALGGTTGFTFDADGNQLSQTDALGNITTATYDDSRNQLTQTDALGNTITFEYNPFGQETRVVDARGNEFNNVYDPYGNLLTVTDPLGNIAANNINAKGQVSLTQDALGNDTTFTYDSDGNKLTETDAQGNTTTWTYDENGNALTESRERTPANGSSVTETTTYEYDARNRVVRTVDALGNETRSEFDIVGNETAQIDQLGRRTEFEYDAYGRLTRTVYPDGSEETKTYDAEGNLLTETDRLGRVTSFTYDALNRRTQTTFADTSSTQTEYDAIGRVTAEIDERGNRTEHEYDDAGRRTLTRDALGNETIFEYDADGNLIRQTDARGNATVFTYNALDQKTVTTFANSSVMSETYDALDCLISKTDQGGIETQYEYDELGRLTQVTDALGGITSYTYDEAGNKLTQTDANGNTTRWEVDSLGRVTARILPMSQREEMGYDAAGNLISRTDFNGSAITFEYDSNNRLTRTVYADSSEETFVYNAVGNRTSATNGNGTTGYVYDSRNRLTQETQPGGAVLTYQYDAAGNRTQVSLTPNAGTAVTTTYGFDALSRLQTVTDADSNVTTYAYDANGNRSSMTYANGNVTMYTYDALNRLTNLDITDGATTVLQSYAYTLHPTGRRTQIVEADGRTTDYMYDDLYRLTQETVTDAVNGNYAADYSYDAVGNRIANTIDGVSTVYTYDDNDRLTQQGGTVYTYDSNGNTLTETLDGNVTSYTYDLRDKLIQVTAGGNTTSYQYNTDGIRTQRTEAGTTTDYLVDSNRDFAQVLGEVEGGTVNVAYVYGDDLISQDRSANVSYYLYDGLGSTRGLSSSAGSLTDSYTYDAFGVELNRTGATENDYRFTGEQYDVALDQYYLRARYYDQGIGRFTQMDTWMGNNSDPVTLHKYLYAANDPANMIDPSGHFFSLGSLSAAQNIQVNLSSLEIDAGTSILDVILDPEGASSTVRNTAIAAGATVLVGLGAYKLIKILSKKSKITQLRTLAGKVTILNKAAPKEIDAAKFLAEKLGVNISIRGTGVKGADFVLDGKLWELKSLEAATNNAVFNGIRKAIKNEQSSRIVIDGRNVGLTKETLIEGIARAQRNNKNPSEIIALLKDGELFRWP